VESEGIVWSRGYFIFEDGRVYTTVEGCPTKRKPKFMKPYKCPVKTGLRKNKPSEKEVRCIKEYSVDYQLSVNELAMLFDVSSTTIQHHRRVMKVTERPVLIPLLTSSHIGHTLGPTTTRTLLVPY
jgi:hypothetical protein